MNSNERMMDLQELLTEEEQWGPIASLAELVVRTKQREGIDRALAVLEKEVDHYRRRLESLPALPDRTCIQWAQQILSYPNGRLLVVDSVFPAEAASIVQLLLLDFTGRVRLRTCVAAGYRLPLSERQHLGISAQDVEEAVSLPQIWPTLLKELDGCYVLAYHWRQARLILEQEAQRFHLEPAVLIGDDLLTWCVRFYQASGLVGLSSLCELIGQPLPLLACITERAQGQLALLEAMAQGITRRGQEDQGCSLNCE